MQSLPESTLKNAPIPAPWAALIPDDQWVVFTSGTRAIREAGVAAMLGGAVGLATYTRHWRNTKDVDVFVRDSEHEKAVAAVLALGFEDYHGRLSYDRSWIFRAYSNGVLFDIIWALPNHRVPIDDAWFERARAVCLRGDVHDAVPIEELVRVKLYVMQRERCDWVDVFNVLAGACELIDWPWLVKRMGRDLPLLQAALSVFAWLSPGRAAAIPVWLREQLALPSVEVDDPAATELRRVRLFDSRPWFASHQPTDRPLDR